MIQHDNTLISLEVLERDFVCNLTACKGACCVEGEWGAPLDEKELEIIESELEKIKPHLTDDSKVLLDKKGFYEKDPDDEYVTTCHPAGECVFAIQENGIYKCGIEKAHSQGDTEFLKPISCHLYPIRLSKVGELTALNYNEWNICDPACTLGKELSLPVFNFLKEALERKFGKEWYSDLEAIAEEYKSFKDE